MKIGKFVLLIFVISALAWGVTFLFKKDVYIGFYYPDANNLTNDIQSEETFSTLQECRDWAAFEATKFGKYGSASDYDDYECGKNCDLQNGQKPYVCEDTLE